MQISKDMEKAINEQINAELFSAYLYMSMQSDFESKNLKGMSTWMKVQAQEEMTHALRLYNFVNERGGKVILEAIEKPKATWETPLDAFEEAYKHEQKVTSLIHKLVDLAKKENDHATESMLKWFIDEQVEEEASADEIVQKIKLMKDAPGGIFMLDQELGKRVFNTPSDMTM